MGAMMGSQPGPIMEKALFSWLAAMDELRHSRDMEHLRGEILQLRAQNSENVMRAMGAMMGSQPRQIMEKALFSWLAAMDELRHSRETEHLREEILKLQAKSSENIMRAMSAMMGSQPRQIMEKALF